MESIRRPVGSIRRAAAVAVLGGVLVLTTACGGGGGAAGSGQQPPAGAALGGAGGAGGGASAPAGARSEQPQPKVSAAVLDITPKNGAEGVAPGALRVSVAGGKLTAVKVTDKDGREIPGAATADGAAWTPAAPLAVGTAYRVSAQASDAAGVPATAESGFTTLTPQSEASPTDNITDGETYGVGMIMSVAFDKDVKNKAEVAKGITFETDNGTVVKGHWFGDRRLDLRPEAYWKPGTKVTVHYRLRSVEISPGVYGGVDRDEPFTIGRSQVSTVDANTHEMTVVRDGQTSVIPITSGSPEHPTWNGTMVISAKEGVVNMRSSTLPGMTGEPYDLMVPHSMRLTDTGTYVHGNYWGHSFGEDNTSHGCVGLADVKGGGAGTVAGKFYDSSLVGDVVTVQNSKRGQVEPDNGLSGWNLAWGSW
ncbi:Ig-like domain-containing protein [Streptomyces sp. CB03911]|uniref:L,D-transpeptidase n=1 Tax=Streptomyces sp. CB03911 TaxID=1804758 RepID=UPI000ADBDC40|nr:Ig-like domain-containing protein [Streptomyces sp. CB03911]